MAKGSSIYAVEGAVWAAIVAAWIAVRSNAAKPALELSVLLPAAILSFGNLLATSLAETRENVELAHFQALFGIWLAFAYELYETTGSQSLSRLLPENQLLGQVSAAFSMALLTVQVLIAAAAVSESPWRRVKTGNVLIVFATSFHVCASHGTPQAMAFAVVVLAANFLSLLLLAVRASWQFPPEWGLGPLSMAQILDICTLSLQTVAISFASATVLMERQGSWLFVVVVAVPLAAGVLVLVYGQDAKYREEIPTPVYQQVVQRPQPPLPQSAPLPVPLPVPPPVPPPRQQRRPPPFNPGAAPNHAAHPRPPLYMPQAALPVLPPAGQRQPPFNPQVIPATITEAFSSVRVAQDALLFRNTRSLVTKNKKMS